MKEYNVLQYGAVGDGATNDAFAIQHAIDDCAKNGGGRVVLQSDSIRLRSNVDLHIQKGARLKATGNIDGYIRPNKLINDPKTALIGNPVTGEVHAGHLTSAVISATLELFLQVWDGDVDRRFSDTVGLNLFEFI